MFVPVGCLEFRLIAMGPPIGTLVGVLMLPSLPRVGFRTNIGVYLLSWYGDPFRSVPFQDPPGHPEFT